MVTQDVRFFPLVVPREGQRHIKTRGIHPLVCQAAALCITFTPSEFLYQNGIKFKGP